MASGAKKGAKKGKKGADVSFLLNMHFEANPVVEEPVHHHARPKRSKYPVISSFKQSIFRLTVAPVRSFVQEKCFWDADTSIPWNIVVSATVLKSDGFDNKCPICLDPLQVPRITECGHLFCYTCILRYIRLCEKSAPRCPVCSKIVCQPDLKCVRLCDTETLPTVGSSCTFQLCCVRSGRMYPVMVQGPHEYDHHFAGEFEELTGSGVPYCQSIHARLSRVNVATVADVHALFAEEREQLLSYQADCVMSSREHELYTDMRGDVEHLPFIHMALESSEERENNIIAQIHTCLATQGGDHSGILGSGGSAVSLLNSPRQHGPGYAHGHGHGHGHGHHHRGPGNHHHHHHHPHGQHPGGSRGTTPSAASGLNLGVPQRSLSASSSCSVESINASSAEAVNVTIFPENIYFYQLGSGDCVYLHPLCVRILMAAAEERARAGSLGGGAGRGRGHSRDHDNVALGDASDGAMDCSGSNNSSVDTFTTSSASSSSVTDRPVNTSPKSHSHKSSRSSSIDHCMELATLVSAPVIELESIKLTAEIRHKTPLLRHLSLGTAVTLIEVDMRQLASATVLAKFREELQARDKRRKQKLQQKQRELEQDEENKMAHEAHVQMLRNMQLQQEQDLEDALRNAPALSSSTHGNGNGHGHGPEDEESPSVMSAPVGAATSSSSNQDKAKSFASITQMSGHFPGLSRGNSTNSNSGTSSTTGSGLRAWGPSSATTVGPSAVSAGGARAPDDFIDVSPVAANRKGGSGGGGGGNGNNNSNKNKGKKKGVPLFSTGGSRNYRA